MRQSQRLGISYSMLLAAAVFAAPAVRADELPHAGYHLKLGFGARPTAGEPQHMQVVREALVKELSALPGITLSLEDGSSPGRTLSRQPGKGFYIDGSILKLSTTRAGGRQRIDCELRVFVATWPQRAIKMITTEGAAVEIGGSPVEEAAGQRDCLLATVGAVGEAIQNYLRNVK